MPRKTTASSKQKDSNTKKAGRAVRRSKQKSKSAEDQAKAQPDQAAQQFIRGVIIRGEAARPDKKGDLPPNVTHRIVEESDDNLPVIEREGFSIV